MKRRHFVGGLFAIVLAQSAPAAQQRPDLDLSTISRPDVGDREGSVRGGMAPELTGVSLAARLIAVEPSECTWHDPITYDLELQNRGKAAVSLPWSVDPRDHEAGSEAGILHKALISLGARVYGREARVGTTEGLFGSPYVQRSVRRLLPGERLVIRATSRCHVDDDAVIELIKNRGSATVQVTARVQLYGARLQSGSLISQNSVRVRIVRSYGW